MAQVVVMTTGTVGDVAPYAGLGERLRNAGHRVLIAANEDGTDVAAASKLDVHPLPGLDLREVAGGETGRAAGRAGVRGAVSMVRGAAAAMHRPIPAMIEAAEGQDVILCTPTTVLFAAPIAEARGVPCAVLALQPTIPTREFGPIVLGGRDLGGWANKLLAQVLGRAAVAAFGATVRSLRRDLGLGPTPPAGRGPSDLPVVHGISPAVLPRPADYPPDAVFAGFWWPPASVWTAPDPRLERFFADGPAPVYIGFGSAGAAHGARLSTAVSRALARTGLRAVVQRGWSGLTVEGPDVITVDHVPHHWLFPRVAAVVHHAGAGTTAAGLRAGRPALPVPFSGDMPFWARRLVAVGAAPRAVPGGMTVDRLVSGLVAGLTEVTTGSRYLAAAQSIGERLRDEDGAAPVLELLDRLVPDHDAGPR